MSAGHDDLDRLTRALAAELAPELLARARADAEARVQRLLTERLTAELLRAVTEGSSPQPAAAPVIEDPFTEPPAAPVTERHAIDPAEDLRPAPGATGVYVYGIVAAGAEPPDLPGIDGEAEVRTIVAGELAALVCDVALDDFGQDALHDHLGDLDWVERVARRHEHVLEDAAMSTAVVPLRLCSIYLDEDRVRRMLTAEGPRLRRTLDDLAGTAEWGIKVFHDPAAQHGDEDAVPAGETGSDYLRRRQEDRARRGRVDSEIGALCETIHHRLSELCIGAKVLAVHRPEASGHTGEMVLNGAYLVPAEQTDAFHSAVGSLTAEAAAAGMDVELTGPWPAYNFAEGSDPDLEGV